MPRSANMASATVMSLMRVASPLLFRPRLRARSRVRSDSEAID